MRRALFTLVEGASIALAGLRMNWVRSLLAILGVAVGVSVVVMVASLITGIRTSIVSGLEAAGPKNFIVMRFDFTAVRFGDDGNARAPWWNKPPLEPEEADALQLLPSVDEALFTFGFGVTVDFEGRRVGGVSSAAYSPGWPAYRPGEFVAGRNFVPIEVRESRPVVVFSEGLAEEVFGRRDPVGRRVGIGSPFRNTRQEFTVIGVYRPEPNPFEEGAAEWTVMPHTTAARRLKVTSTQAQILIVPEDSVSQARVMADVTAEMRRIRGLGPRDENTFALLRSDQIIEMFDRFTALFFAVMLGLSSAGLLVGGIGVIGIMLISVTERTREIGVRKALGATRQEILWQFLVEAATLTVTGGALGMLAGVLFAEGIERYTPVPATIPLWAIAAALAMATFTGMVFGMFPAQRAARLDPVDALRHEI